MVIRIVANEVATAKPAPGPIYASAGVTGNNKTRATSNRFCTIDVTTVFLSSCKLVRDEHLDS
jgi:hypothetical protein